MSSKPSPNDLKNTGEFSSAAGHWPETKGGRHILESYLVVWQFKIIFELFDKEYKGNPGIDPMYLRTPQTEQHTSRRLCGLNIGNSGMGIIQRVL